MKTLNVIFLGSLLTLGAIGHAADATNDLEKELNRLAKVSKRSKEPCEKYWSEIEKNALTEERNGVEIFKSKAIALSVLERLSHNPGTPKSTQEANRLIVAQKPSDLEKASTQSIQSALTDLQPYCGMVRQYVNLQRLLDGRAVYPLSREELNQVKRLIFDFIDSESSAPTPLTSSLIQIALLDRLVETGLIGDQKKFGDRIKKLSQDGQSLKSKLQSRIKDNSGHGDQKFASNALFELFETNRLRKEVRDLFLQMTSAQ